MRRMGAPFVAFAALFCLGASCSVGLRPDHSIPAVEAGYPTAEASVFGQSFRGVNIVSAPKGMPLSDLKLEVHGYFQGTVRVDSENCQISLSVRYDKTGPVKIDLPGVLEKNCIFGFVVSPELPDQKSSAEIVHSLKGILAVRIDDKPDLAWIGARAVFPKGFTFNLDLPLPDPPILYLVGCGKNVSQAKSRVVVSDLVNGRSCVLTGFAAYGLNPDVLIDILAIKYAEGFVEVSKPSVSFAADDRLCVQADESVSFIWFDDRLFRGSFACYAASAGTVIRGLTVKGRGFVGVVKEDGAVDLL